MIVAGSGHGIDPTTFFATGAAAVAVLGALGAWIGKPLRAAANERRLFFSEMRGHPPQTQLGANGQPVVTVPGRPGIPAQIVDLRTSLQELSESVHEATRLMELLAHVPEQLKDNRDAFEVQFARHNELAAEARRLAADAAINAARSDQRISELAELIGAQIEGLHEQLKETHQENLGFRAVLHELGLEGPIPRPGDNR